VLSFLKLLIMPKIILFLFVLLVLSPNLQSSADILSPPKLSQNRLPATKTLTRVVALTSISADLIQQLDNKKLVGMSGSSLFDKDARFKNIPTVSSGRTAPNIEKIIALKPDLVIGAVGFHDQVLKRMNQLGIRTIATELNSWTDLEVLIKQLAESTQSDPNSILKRFQNCSVNVAKKSASTLVLVSRQPILSPNRESWAGSLLERFKIKNVTAKLQEKSPMRGYITLSAERVLQANPEVIILVDVPMGDVSQFKTLSFWNQLQATKKNQVFTFDYYGLINPGSIVKIEQACKQLKDILASN